MKLAIDSIAGEEGDAGQSSCSASKAEAIALTKALGKEKGAWNSRTWLHVELRE